METDIKEIISSIERIKGGNHFKKYIEFIQFPFYRNFEINSRIQFRFPLTVLTGQNGCGKSSALHALYGTVYGKTPYEFWFDTDIDPIKYYDDERRRHSFWYQFKDESGEFVEVVKARIRRENDPNYWETSRPLLWAGMQKSEKNQRGKPVRKNVVYIDFREELSAFDKYFYFKGTLNGNNRSRQEFIREQSAQLNKVFEGSKPFIFDGKRKLNSSLYVFNADELEAISYILGKKYLSGKYVKHSLFLNEGYSVLFTTDYATYSEAFAGSGEMAVFRLVERVLKAPDYSLILLDEPEVSLHPGAQERLKVFLLTEIRRKRHQVIVTSHSPSIITGLPASAIKTFYQNSSSGRFAVIEDLTPEEAFFHIEFRNDNQKNLIVEDKLAAELVRSVLQTLDDSTRSLFNVKFYPGGESVLKKELATVYCRSIDSKDFIILDGDQRRVSQHLNWRELANSDITVKNLTKKINEQTGETIKFSVDGGIKGADNEQQLELLKVYLDYYFTNIYYLPGLIPEDLIWNTKKAFQSIKLTKNDNDEIEIIMNRLENIPSSKQKFSELAQIVFGSAQADDISSLHKIFIQAWINLKNSDYNYIKEILKSIKENKQVY